MTLSAEDRWEIAYEKHVEDLCTGAYLDWPPVNDQPEPKEPCSYSCNVAHRSYECPELGQADWPPSDYCPDCKMGWWLHGLNEMFPSLCDAPQPKYPSFPNTPTPF